VILLCIGVTAALCDAHTKILQVYLSGALFREIPVSTCAKLRGIAETVKDLRAAGSESVSEFIQLDSSPVGYTAVPYPVGGNGPVYSINLEMNFQPASELKLKTRLEELRLANKVEAVERTIPIGHLEPNVVGDVPVHHWRESPELAPSQ
jgi:hypothetical protein